MSIVSKIVTLLRASADRLANADHRHDKVGAPRDTASLDEYVVRMPSAQNAVAILPGWNQPVPPDYVEGTNPGGFYNDSRIHWALDLFGAIEGADVLELGPLEGAHTCLLEGRGAKSITAIEANKLCFMRCLINKEVLNLKRSRFLLGDFQIWLENTPQRYDLILASGVLYHMQDPLRLIELIAEHTDAVYFWTHYINDEAMPKDDIRRVVFVGEPEIVPFHGVNVRLHRRSYHGAWRDKSFCGGTHDIHRWIEREDLMAVLGALGFDDVHIAHDEWQRPNGPAFSVFARRTRPTLVESSDAGDSETA